MQQYIYIKKRIYQKEMFPRFCHFLGFSPKSLFLEISGDNSFSKIFTSREVDDILKIVCSLSLRFLLIVNLFCWVPLMRSIGFCDFVLGFQIPVIVHSFIVVVIRKALESVWNNR